MANLSEQAQDALWTLSLSGSHSSLDQLAGHLQQLTKAHIHAGLVELEGAGFARESFGLWELTAAGRKEAGRD